MNAKIEPFEDEVINAIEMNPSSFEANYSAVSYPNYSKVIRPFIGRFY